MVLDQDVCNDEVVLDQDSLTLYTSTPFEQSLVLTSDLLSTCFERSGISSFTTSGFYVDPTPSPGLVSLFVGDK